MIKPVKGTISQSHAQNPLLKPPSEIITLTLLLFSPTVWNARKIVNPNHPPRSFLSYFSSLTKSPYETLSLCTRKKSHTTSSGKHHPFHSYQFMPPKHSHLPPPYPFLLYWSLLSAATIENALFYISKSPCFDKYLVKRDFISFHAIYFSYNCFSFFNFIVASSLGGRDITLPTTYHHLLGPPSHIRGTSNWFIFHRVTDQPFYLTTSISFSIHLKVSFPIHFQLSSRSNSTAWGSYFLCDWNPLATYEPPFPPFSYALSHHQPKIIITIIIWSSQNLLDPNHHISLSSSQFYYGRINTNPFEQLYWR